MRMLSGEILKRFSCRASWFLEIGFPVLPHSAHGLPSRPANSSAMSSENIQIFLVKQFANIRKQHRARAGTFQRRQGSRSSSYPPRPVPANSVRNGKEWPPIIPDAVDNGSHVGLRENSVVGPANTHTGNITQDV